MAGHEGGENPAEEEDNKEYKREVATQGMSSKKER